MRAFGVVIADERERLLAGDFAITKVEDEPVGAALDDARDVSRPLEREGRSEIEILLRLYRLAAGTDDLRDDDWIAVELCDDRLDILRWHVLGGIDAEPFDAELLHALQEIDDRLADVRLLRGEIGKVRELAVLNLVLVAVVLDVVALREAAIVEVVRAIEAWVIVV